MAGDRETALAALAARLQTVVGSLLKIPVSRKLRAWADVDQVDQPALFCVATHDVPSVSPMEPARHTLGAHVVIYARCDADPAVSAEPLLNQLIAAVEDALTPQTGDATGYAWTNLGGAVAYAMPGGPIEYESGAQGCQGIAYFPIELVLVPR